MHGSPKLPNWFSGLLWNIDRFEQWAKNTKLVAFVERHKRWLVFTPAIIVSVQLYIMTDKRDKWRTKHEEKESENSFLRAVSVGRNATMDDFDVPWWEKIKRGDRFILSDLNDAYEISFGIMKLDALGKSNFDLVPEEAAYAYYKVDSTVTAQWRGMFAVEPFIFPDETKIKLFVYKWPRLERNDTIISGMAIPLTKVIKVIDDKGNLEVIEIVPDTVSNSIQDTILRK